MVPITSHSKNEVIGIAKQRLAQDTYHIINESAKLFRSAIESMEPTDFPNSSWFVNYPRGCCGDTCNLFAKYLIEKGLQAKYVWGMRGEQSHAWLEYNGWIIDLTADQFEEISEKIVISKNKKWYSNFKGQRKTYNDFDQFNGYNSSRLGTIYQNILHRMDRQI